MSARAVRLLPVLFAVLLVAPPAPAQEAGAGPAPADVEPDQPSSPAAAGQDTAGTGEAPDPATWMAPGDVSPRLWLDQPLLDPADLKARLPAYQEVLASHGLDLDTDTRTLSVRGSTLWDNATLGYPIEYLVVTELGRTHEAVVLIRAMPSVIDACLKALDLQPGSPTVFEEKDPQPPDELVESGEVSRWNVRPASGPILDIRVTWIDDAGVPVDVSLESMLIDVRTGLPLPDKGWIYTGSHQGRYRQGRDWVDWYKADVEGDVVAIYLAGLGVCLFERNSLDGIDDALYTLNPAVVPERGTPVTLQIRPTGEVVPPRGLLPVERFLKPAPVPEGVSPDDGDAPPEDGADG